MAAPVPHPAPFSFRYQQVPVLCPWRACAFAQRRQTMPAIVQDTYGAADTVVAARPGVIRFAASNEVVGIGRGSLSA
jgi:hypothetical protein